MSISTTLDNIFTYIYFPKPSNKLQRSNKINETHCILLIQPEQFLKTVRGLQMYCEMSSYFKRLLKSSNRTDENGVKM